MQIRQLQVNEYDRALTLSLDVFIQCGKNDFDEEGLETFKSFIYNKDLVNELTIYGAFEGESLIGLIATKESIFPYSSSRLCIMEKVSANDYSRPLSKISQSRK